MKLNDAYQLTVRTLNHHKIDEAEFKALCLTCSLLDIKNSEFHRNAEHQVDESRLNELLNRLIDGEPLQYVIGKWDFYESEFIVGNGVLIPRPETEELVEEVIRYAGDKKDLIVIDLCSGSGCIGLSIAKKIKQSVVYCIEKSDEAFRYLSMNAENVGQAKIICGDISDQTLISTLPLADIIVSNPPYVRTEELLTLQEEVKAEPKMALDGGKDGLDFYRLINDLWSYQLKPDGKLFLEIGNEQGNDIVKIMQHFGNVKVKKDLYGNDRMAICSFPRND